MTKYIVGNAKEIVDLIPGFTYHSAWDSPEAFARHIEAANKKEAWCKAGWDEGADFTGTNNMEEALDLAANGWREGADRIEGFRDKILAMKPTHPKTIKYSLAGAYPDVVRAISGNPINMRVPDLAKSRRRPVITLLSDMSTNGSVNKDAITNRASVVAAIIDQIEAAGYACEVIATAPTKGCSWGESKDYTAITSVLVKKTNQPVDLIRLSYGLGHASMFRRLIFADWGIHPANEKGIGRGLGSHKNFDKEYLNDKAIYVIPSAEGHSSKFKTEEIASTKGMEFLIDSLKAQGCSAFGNERDKEAIEAKEIEED